MDVCECYCYVTNICLLKIILRSYVAIILENGVRVSLLVLSNMVQNPVRRLISYTSAVPPHGSRRTTITFYIYLFDRWNSSPPCTCAADDVLK